MFKTNVGTADRVIRILVGVVLLAAFFMMPDSPWRWVALVLGVIGVGTGAMSSCPLYSILGLSTCPVKKG